MWESLPEFGTGVLYAVLVAAAYTFAVSVAAGRGRPRLLSSARLGAYATCGLVMLGVTLLAYAFITHDFRIRYVARYSDRSMTTPYCSMSSRPARKSMRPSVRSTAPSPAQMGAPSCR